MIFLAFATNKKPEASNKTIGQMLRPLREIRVWRFGLYYFLVFGCFVAFSQWLVPYFVNVYYLLSNAAYLLGTDGLAGHATRTLLGRGDGGN